MCIHAICLNKIQRVDGMAVRKKLPSIMVGMQKGAIIFGGDGDGKGRGREGWLRGGS
jgi:hypothetical protein